MSKLPYRENSYVPLEKRTRIHELDTVVLTHDIQEHGLRQGDIGAVVHCYSNGDTYEVEFVTGEGGGRVRPFVVLRASHAATN